MNRHKNKEFKTIVMKHQSMEEDGKGDNNKKENDIHTAPQQRNRKQSDDLTVHVEKRKESQ